ncbi:MAG: hypothetical protein BWY34_00571 [Parcubacteria group bacterium ADurb.Bin247]|jgi:hypothetical protein|nr:MAG: hypothetical protein BWY34_00571 [Parcubacteria group bacterium ADurb.Bin247]HQB85019.1 hypothetical protein [Candidatus Pacearchaeota archaeon]
MKISKEEFFQLYKTLPPKVKNALFDEEVGLTLTKICKRHMVETRYQEMMDLIVEVLVGLLPPQDLEKILIRDLNIPISSAKEISIEINRFIFFPIKDDLLSIYQTNIASQKVIEESASVENQEFQDSYREKF